MHTLLVGAASVEERDGQAKLRFVLSRGDAASRSSLLLAGEPEDRALHDLALLRQLLETADRRVETDDRVGLLRAVNGILAHVRVRALDDGFAVLDEVLKP
jgi:hypothetical protein